MHTGRDRKTTPRAARGDHTCEEKKKVPGMFDPEHGKENEKSEMTKKKKKKSFAVVQVPAVYWREK